MNEEISVSRPLLKELYKHFDTIDKILTTIEELSDKKGLKRIEMSLEEYRKKECTSVTLIVYRFIRGEEKSYRVFLHMMVKWY